VSENSEVARNKEENQTVLTPGGELQRPREPVGGLAGRHSRSPLVTRNKHSDCPQNPEHLPFSPQLPWDKNRVERILKPFVVI
jgi:hypothetical protein